LSDVTKIVQEAFKSLGVPLATAFALPRMYLILFLDRRNSHDDNIGAMQEADKLLIAQPSLDGFTNAGIIMKGCAGQTMFVHDIHHRVATHRNN
jgi:hypothetical protein